MGFGGSARLKGKVARPLALALFLVAALLFAGEAIPLPKFLGEQTVGLAIAAEPDIDVTAEARQTVHSSGVPHTDRAGNVITTYDPAQSVFLNGIFSVSDEPRDGGAIPALANAGFNSAVTTRTRGGADPSFSDPAFFTAQLRGEVSYAVVVQSTPPVTRSTQGASISVRDEALRPGQSYSFSVCAPDCDTGTLVREGTVEAKQASVLGEGEVEISWKDGSDLALFVDNRIHADANQRFDPDTFNDERFEQYKSDPQVFGWWMVDEAWNVTTAGCRSDPSRDCESELSANFGAVSDLYEAYRPQTDQVLVFDEASYRDEASDFADPWWPRFVDTGDVASVYHYPKILSGVGSLEGTAEQVARMVEARGTLGGSAEKPAWFIPQAFDGWPGALYMTPEQAKAQAYTAIVHGATGLIQFGWDSCALRYTGSSWLGQPVNVAGIRPRLQADRHCLPDGDPDRSDELRLSQARLDAGRQLWDAFDADKDGINKEIGELSPWLLSPTSQEPYEVLVDSKPNPSWSPVRTMLKYRDGTYYLLAVNVDDAPVEARFTFPKEVVSPTLPFESSRTPDVEGTGTIRDQFAPLDVHVYRFGLDPGQDTPGQDTDGGEVNVSSARDVCHIPRPGNNGRVVGHDGGASVRFGEKVYFLFGDTYVDSNGDGGLSVPGDRLMTGGSIAMTGDMDAGDCIDLTYKTDDQGFASPLLDLAPGESCAWAGPPVVANDQLYFYNYSVRLGHCNLEDFQADAGLAKLVGDPQEMDAVRVGAGERPLLWQWGEPQFLTPLPVTDSEGTRWIYVFGFPTPLAPRVYVARVREQSIESPSAYRYWDGSGWASAVSQSEPIFADAQNGMTNRPAISYNTELGRYLAIYSCGFGGTQVCARTARQTGDSAEAIVGGWGDPEVIYDCPNDFTTGPWLDCYAAFQHPEYGDGATIYVTTARNTGSPRRYWLMLRELVVSDQSPSGDVHLIDAASDFSSQQGTTDPSDSSSVHEWLYRARRSSTDQPLSWSGFLEGWTCPIVQGAACPDPVGPGPLLNEDTALPGQSTDAVRTWVAPSSGTLRLSGEAWTHFGCGDGARASVVKVRGGQTTDLWSAELGTALNPSRSALYDFSTAVGRGDTIDFRVARAGSNATCDQAYFNPTMVFDSSNVAPPNQPPEASFVHSPAAPMTLEPVTFSSTSTDADGVVQSLAWDLDNDGNFDDGSGTSAQRSFPFAGRYTVALRVTDDKGEADTESRDVDVRNRSPQASFTASLNPALTGQIVLFDGSASSDPEGPIARYEWDLDGNGSFETDTGVAPTVTRSYSSAGDYTVGLRVTDGDGAGAQTTRRLTVLAIPVNQIPTAFFTVSPRSAYMGQLVRFDGSASSDPEGPIARYEWDLDGNGSFETDTGAISTASRSYANAGDYTVGLRVTDGDGASGDAARTLAVLAPDSAVGSGESPAPTGPTATFGPIGPATDSNAPRIRISRRSVRVNSRGNVPVRIWCPASEAYCDVHVRLRTAGIALGSRSVRVAGGRMAVARVRLKRKKRRIVAKLGRVRVRALARTRDAAGNVRKSSGRFRLLAPSSPRRP